MIEDVIASVFHKRGGDGDFEWMIRQNIHNSDLFIFNDNEYHCGTSVKGGGSASVRPYNIYGYIGKKLDRPMAHGIPTGTFRGYTNLAEGKAAIDASIAELRQLIKKYDYINVYFPADNTGILGSGIFDVPLNVRLYITKELRNLL